MSWGIGGAVVSESIPSSKIVDAGSADSDDPWQRTVSMAAQLHTLEGRVQELERDLKDADIGARCRSCKSFALRHKQTRGPYNGTMMEEQWSCASCGYRESRIYAESDQPDLISTVGG